MRIELGELAAHRLNLDLPASEPGALTRELRVESAEALSGTLITGADGFRLSDVGSARLALSKLHWSFGRLGLATDQAAVLSELTANVHDAGEQLDIALAVDALDAVELRLELGNMRICAQVHARALKLASREGVGLLTAEHAVFNAFELRAGTLHLALPELKVSQLVIDWGGEELHFEAGTLDASALSLARAGVALRGSGLDVAALRVTGSQIKLGLLRLGQLDVQAELPRPSADSRQLGRPETASEAAQTAPKAPAEELDYGLLDGLAGQLDVDVDLDLAVPIIGHRQAVHALRIAIDQGALNYRQLEHSLARLEDSLLDFSVRDGGLVLERGLPLISTRGRGKPILIWDMEAADLALAEQHRVRLAVLPKFRFASAGQSQPPREDDGGSGSGGIKLLHVWFENIDAALKLSQNPASADGPLSDLTFADLTVRGAVRHDPDGPARAGTLALTLAQLRTSLRSLALGSQHLSGRLELAALRETTIDLAGLQVVRVKSLAEGITLTDVQLG